MIGRTTAYFAALLTVSVSTQATAETVAGNHCWRPEERVAAQVLTMQSMLMVRALKCQDTLPAAVDGYNRFLQSKRELLVGSKHVVEGHFVRQQGAEIGATSATNYQTHLGNQTSAPVIDPDQCRVAGAYARVAATASDDDLLVLAKLIAPAEAVEACPVVVAVAAPTAMIIKVWPKPVPVVAVPTVAEPVALIAAPPAPLPTVTPVVATAAAPPMAPVATAPAVPIAPPAQDRRADQVKALQAATAALTQAVAALQAVPAGGGS